MPLPLKESLAAPFLAGDPPDRQNRTMPTGPDLRTVLGDVVASTGHRYDAKDSAGHPMDTVKIISNPDGGYLGVYHSGDEVHLAGSTNLLDWQFLRTLDGAATQPTITALPTGAFLTAVEYNNQAGSGGRVRVRHYPTLIALLAGDFDRNTTLRRTLSRCHEGTPTIESVQLLPDIDHSRIELNFHYHRDCDVDRQAHGVLTDFTDFTAGPDTAADDRLIAAAAVAGHRVNGNIGDRDSAVVDGVRYSLYEVQYVKGDFGSWRIYLHDGTTGVAEYLPVCTHGGSTALANPTITVVTSPDGRPAIVVTLFVPTEGAAPGEAGQLIYFRQYAPTT